MALIQNTYTKHRTNRKNRKHRKGTKTSFLR